MTTSKGNQRTDTYVHLNAIKANWNSSVNVLGIWLVPGNGSSDIAAITTATTNDGQWYNLQGQPVAKPSKGLYIRKGKKVVIK